MVIRGNHQNVRKKPCNFDIHPFKNRWLLQYFAIEVENIKIYLNDMPTSFQNASSTILVWNLCTKSRGVLPECRCSNAFKTPDFITHCYPIFYYS